MKTMTPRSEFEPAGFFVLRTPLLPFDEFLQWSDGHEAIASLDDPERFERAYDADCERLRKHLNSIVTRPEVRDALFLASPNIIKRFHLWIDDPNSNRGRKIEHVLVRYFARMTGRATPFGLFAGVSTGAIGNETKLEIAERAHYRRHTRLDMDYLDSLSDALTRDASLRKGLTFRPNSSLYYIGDRVHYIESRANEKVRSYYLVAVEKTGHLKITLERAVEGATAETLITALRDDGVHAKEAHKYVAQLIEGQIILPDIGLNVSGRDPASLLIEQLRKTEQTAGIGDVLQGVQDGLQSIDRAGPGADLKHYSAIAQKLESLPAPVEKSRLFHVDLVKPASAAVLGAAVLEEIQRGVQIVHSLSPRRQSTDLTRFRAAFLKRYEEREVPLVEALDEELGIGFGESDESSSLLRNLDFHPLEEEDRIDREREDFILRLLCEALSSGAREIKVSEGELEKLSAQKPDPLPHSFAFEATVAARSQRALAAGDFRVLIGNGSGPSAARTMGRFCHADEDLRERVVTLLRREEADYPDAVFAEIVHLPHGKIANVASRPQMRDYEIPFLGRSVADCDHQIPITDLYVSIRNRRIHLRSGRLGREVIPRLTNAHNYSWQTPGIYRFLCRLQSQDTAWLPEWDWGALATAPFVPRISCGRIVLSLARWYVKPEELHALGKEKGSARFRAVQSWRLDRDLPRWLTLADRDNLLPVDLNNVLSVESFVQLVKEREAVTLLELFPPPDELCAFGPEGSFVHKLIVPFVSEPTAARAASNRSDAVTEAPLPQAAQAWRFAPGSEWLYVKLYTGPATADRVLRDLVGPIIENIKRNGDANRWFFMRYSDPDFHLRLRFHGKPNRLRDRLQPLLDDALNPLLADNRIWRVQFDTYEREIERYGGTLGIELSEEFFQIDSEAVLQLLETLEAGDEGADERWRLAVYGIDRLLNDFGFELEAKHSILQKTRDSFAQEFRMEPGLRSQLSERYRKERKALQMLFQAQPDFDHSLGPSLVVLRDRSQALRNIIEKLWSSEQKHLLSVSVRRLAQLYMHLHMIRLLRFADRREELVTYDFLTRLYESQLRSSVKSWAMGTPN